MVAGLGVIVVVLLQRKGAAGGIDWREKEGACLVLLLAMGERGTTAVGLLGGEEK